MKPLSRGQWCFDLAVAAAFVVIGQYELRFLPESGYQEGPLALNTVLTFLSAASLSVRRRWPLTALTFAAVPFAIASVITAHAMGFWGTAVPLAILYYSALRWSRYRYAGLVAFGVAALLLGTFGIHVPTFATAESLVFGVAMLGLAAVSGAIISRLTTQQQALDAAMVLLREQEQDRQSQMLADERARISREMHDVMAHGISVMVVQTGAARLELAPEADKARESLLIVEQTGRAVLAELRRTVGLLRGGETTAGSDPIPSLDDIPALAESMRAAGLDVRIEVEPGLDLDPGRALAAYRVVQEALTNSLRHSGPGTVLVRVARPDDLRIEVIDSCASSAAKFAGGSGNGLVGLKERVAMFDGELTAGPEPQGFALRARIPMGGGR